MPEPADRRPDRLRRRAWHTVRLELLGLCLHVHIDSAALAAKRFWRSACGRDVEPRLAVPTAEGVEQFLEGRDDRLEIFLSEIRPGVVVHCLVHGPLLDTAGGIRPRKCLPARNGGILGSRISPRLPRVCRLAEQWRHAWENARKHGRAG